MIHFLSVILTILNNLLSDIYLFEYVHVKEDNSDAWYFLSNISVKYLSPDPDIPENLLKGLGGSLTLRVCGVNQAGCGDCAEHFWNILGTAD